jgi:8-oxo-dGTP diphosphatase
MRVTAAIIIRDNRVLIAKRPDNGGQAGRWEFPGGKIEDGESPEECLRRELYEELEIEVEVKGFFEKSIYRYDKGAIELLAYRAEWVGGDIRVREHDEIRWVYAWELDSYELMPADLPIKDKLQRTI